VELWPGVRRRARPLACLGRSCRPSGRRLAASWVRRPGAAELAGASRHVYGAPRCLGRVGAGGPAVVAVKCLAGGRRGAEPQKTEGMTEETAGVTRGPPSGHVTIRTKRELQELLPKKPQPWAARPLYSAEAVLGRAPQGAPARCCSAAPRCGGLGSSPDGAPLLCAGPLVNRSSRNKPLSRSEIGVLGVLAWLVANGVSGLVLVLLLLDPTRPLGPILGMLSVAVVAWLLLIRQRRAAWRRASSQQKEQAPDRQPAQLPPRSSPDSGER
jgi:hypothetical protein